MAKYVALLRGINVGGNNIIKMSELKASFEKLGMKNVRTYINSGNVLFTSSLNNQTKLAETIQHALAKDFTAAPPVVVKSLEDMQTIVANAPKGWGTDTLYNHDCIFLKEPLTPKEALAAILIKEGVDIVAMGPGVLYFSRLTSRRTQSYLPRFVGTSAYKSTTIRNYNTTTKLLRLMEA